MYVVGQPYKRVVAMKDGSPVYEMTAIVAVHPDKLVLANGTIIDYVGPESRSLPPVARDLRAVRQAIRRWPLIRQRVRSDRQNRADPGLAFGLKQR